jgi:hypothetical protein
MNIQPDWYALLLRYMTTIQSFFLVARSGLLLVFTTDDLSCTNKDEKEYKN